MKNCAAKKILLVEDEILIALAEKQEMENRGYEVVVVHSGEKAVEYCCASKCAGIDLILMDINLGKGIDGTEAAESILAGRDLPLVFLSSHTDPEMVEKTEKITSYGYVVKNSGITVLDASIKMAFRLFESRQSSRRSEENLRITLHSIGDAVIATDEAGCVSRMNPAAEILTGWTIDESLGKPLKEVFNIVHAVTRKEAVDPVEQVLRTGKTVGLANHTLLISKNGKEYQIADSAAPIKDGAGKTRGVILVFRDVTEEYAMREKLTQSEKRFRRLYESMSEGVCEHRLVYNDDGQAVDYIITGANQRYQEILGNNIKDIIGRPATEVYGTDEAPYLETYAKVAEGHGPARFETYYQPIDKHFAISVFSPAKGVFATIFSDITERKKAEDRSSSFAHMVDIAPSSIVIHDFDGNILYANERTFEMHGYAREEFLGMNLRELDVPQSGELIVPRMQRIEEQGDAYFEVEHFRKDGTAFPLEVYVKKIFWENQKALLSIATDISWRKRAEQDLKLSVQRNRELLSELQHSVPLHEYCRSVVLSASTVWDNMKAEIACAEMSVPVKTAIPLGVIMAEWITNAGKHAFSGKKDGTVAFELVRGDGNVILRYRDNGIGLPEGLDPASVRSPGLSLIRELTEQIEGTLLTESIDGLKYTITFPADEDTR